MAGWAFPNRLWPRQRHTDPINDPRLQRSGAGVPPASMTKVKIGLLLLVVVVVAGGSTPHHPAVPSRPAAAQSPVATQTDEIVLDPSRSTPSPCVARETVIPPGGVPCPLVPPPTSTPPPSRSDSPEITFCPTAPVAIQTAPGTIQLKGYVCGRGFHSNETVTLAATGAGHTMSWQLVASSAGTFASPLPPLLCRLAPATLVATGSTGDRSNSLVLSATSCLPAL